MMKRVTLKMQPDNIIFVKHGDKYNHNHVNRLYSQLLEYYPSSNYYCYTENPGLVNTKIIPIFKRPTLRFWWNKLAMFSKDFPVKGTCLYFDLDMDIKKDFCSFINDYEGLTVLKDYWKEDLFYRKHSYDVRINSSIITWTAGEQSNVWDHFLSNKDYFTRKYPGIDRFLVYEGFELKTFGDGLVNSVANPYEGSAPIDMYNGINYELQRANL